MTQESTHNNEPDIRFITWQEAAQSPRSLATGDIVTGFKNLFEVDVLAHNTGLMLLHPERSWHQMELPQRQHST